MTTSPRPPVIPAHPEPAALRSGLYRLTPAGPCRAGLVRPKDEVIFGLHVRAGAQPSELVVEFWRGERCRDRRREQLSAGADVTRGWQLRWGLADGSARLTCRVLLDGREVARRTALLGPSAVDAQGRFAGGADRAASDATLLAFAEEGELLLGRCNDRREK